MLWSTNLQQIKNDNSRDQQDLVYTQVYRLLSAVFTLTIDYIVLHSDADLSTCYQAYCLHRALAAVNILGYNTTTRTRGPWDTIISLLKALLITVIELVWLFQTNCVSLLFLSGLLFPLDLCLPLCSGLRLINPSLYLLSIDYFLFYHKRGQENYQDVN